MRHVRPQHLEHGLQDFASRPLSPLWPFKLPAQTGVELHSGTGQRGHQPFGNEGTGAWHFTLAFAFITHLLAGKHRAQLREAEDGRSVGAERFHPTELGDGRQQVAGVRSSRMIQG